MKKIYDVKEITRKRFVLEGTEAEIADEIETIMSDPINIMRDYDDYSYEAKEIDTFEEEVQKYLDSFTPKWARKDLEQVLINCSVLPTEENLKKFMELNPRMKGFEGCLIEDWFERMSFLVNRNDYELAVKKWKMDDLIVEIRIGDDYLGEELDGYSEAYEVYVGGDMKWNYITLGNAKDICSGIGIGRKVEVLV